ncbi:MAG: SGNH/GDSL hydrolase family protein [Ruminococcus sp.]|nr:SGNH/GDSL hydrolase family protein [Ruminococcus sp.]
MKKSLLNKIRKKMFFAAVTALGITMMCTSCQGNDEPQEEDLPVIADNSQISETSTTAETQSETTETTVAAVETQAYSIELQTTTIVTTVSAKEISVPMGTQAEVTKPPVTHYDNWPSEYSTTTADGTAVTGIEEDTTISSSVGTAYSQSPNSSFYQERLFIAGDSIAYGFNAYGLIPSEHSIAKESVSMWNLDYFTFNTGVGLVDTVEYMHPELLYMSMGINDVNCSTPEQFAERYQTVINQIRDRVPDINIIVAGITPVTNESDFASNDTICSFNTALKNMISALNSNRVYYFDAYSVLSDPATNALRPENTGGDGIHLTTQCYYDTLNALFTFLDNTPVKSNIEKSESEV